jgi:hypothetical protein
MIRPFVAYVLASFVLLSQVGLPVHFHYCKGMLESVSVFIQKGCDDHEEKVDLSTCCQKSAASHCSGENDTCCDYQVKILTQNITSLTPHFTKWLEVAVDIQAPLITGFNAPKEDTISSSLLFVGSGTGPPIYILHHSLIYYA